MPAPTTSARAIVARFADGTMLKGTTHDFGPDKDLFHLYVDGDEKKAAVAILISALKAVFFVKTYQGNRYHVEDKSFRPGTDPGRRVRVIFKDKEEIVGFAPGSIAGRAGFFMVPTDPASNNHRIFIVHAAVAKTVFPPREAGNQSRSGTPVTTGADAAAGGSKGRR